MTELALALSSLLCCDLSQNRLDDVKAMDQDLDSATEDNSSTDVGAFLLLLSQIQLPQTPDQNRDFLNLTQAHEVQEPTSSSSEAASCWEDNIAVTWINSDFYEQNSANVLLAQNAAVDIAQQLVEQSASTNTVEYENLIDNSMPIDTQSVETLTAQADAQIAPTNAEAQLISDKMVLTKLNQETPFAQEKDKAVDILRKNVGVPVTNSSFTSTSLKPQDLSDLPGPQNQSDSVLISAPTSEIVFNTDNNEQIYSELPLSDMGMNAADFQDSALSSTSVTTAAPISQNPEKMFVAMPTLTIPVPVEHSQWSQQLAEHTLWLGQTGQQSALLKLHPEELGPLQIHVQVTESNAAVHITSPTPELRDLIDQSVLRLQELMAEQGLTLVEVNIQAGDGRSQQRFVEPVLASLEPDEPEVLENNALFSKKTQRSQNLIDYFA